MIRFGSEGDTSQGYLALPASKNGRGVLVLHAWWGLNPFFRKLCDRFAQEGFVAFAPDLYHGKIASTPDQAERIMEERDLPATRATAIAALDFLRGNPAIQNKKIGAIGFSMGASYALLLDSIQPDAFAATVLFYGESGAEFSKSKSKFLCHYGENDEWEPLDQVKKIAAPNVTVHIYPDAGHWFFESDRPENFNPQAAALAWERTLSFFKAKLPS